MDHVFWDNEQLIVAQCRLWTSSVLLDSSCCSVFQVQDLLHLFRDVDIWISCPAWFLPRAFWVFFSGPVCLLVSCTVKVCLKHSFSNRARKDIGGKEEKLRWRIQLKNEKHFQANSINSGFTHNITRTLSKFKKNLSASPSSLLLGSPKFLLLASLGLSGKRGLCLIQNSWKPMQVCFYHRFPKCWYRRIVSKEDLKNSMRGLCFL